MREYENGKSVQRASDKDEDDVCPQAFFFEHRCNKTHAQRLQNEGKCENGNGECGECERNFIVSNGSGEEKPTQTEFGKNPKWRSANCDE